MPGSAQVETAQAHPLRPFFSVCCVLPAYQASAVQNIKCTVPRSALCTQWQQSGLSCRFCCQDRLKVYIQVCHRSLCPSIKARLHMQYTFREEDEFLSLQRLPGRGRPTHMRPSTPYIDPAFHTADHPFCPDWSCTCHEEDQESTARVNHWVQEGLMTPQEATAYILGRIF